MPKGTSMTSTTSANITATPRKQPKITATPRQVTATPRVATPVAPVVSTERPSDPFKQGVAGVTDAFTSLPAFAGYVGAGLEATYDTATGEGDQSFLDNFETAVESGVDADLIKTSGDARSYVNDAFKIKEPVSTEDQAARIFGAFMVPIPGSAAPNLLNKAASFALPIVRRGAGFGKRVKQQALFGGAIGTGIDQGVRAVQDLPLMFSEQALTGNVPEPEVSATARNLPGTHKLRDLDKKVEEAQSRQDSIKWATSGALILGASILARRPISRAIQKIRKPKEFGNQLHEDFMDASTAAESGLRAVGTSDQSISRVVHNSHTDPTDMAFNWLNYGELGQDFAFPARLIPRSFSQLNEKFIALGNKQQMFEDAMTASVDKIERAKGKPTNLWKGARKSDTELDKIIRAGTDDVQVKELMNTMGQQYELMLRYQVHRGTMTKARAVKLMNQSRIDGRVGYMPIYKPDERSFLSRLASKYLSFGGRARTEADYLSEFAPSNPVSGGNHLSPLDAYRKYAIHTIADANEQSFKANLLDKLSGISRGLDGGINPLPQYGRQTARDTTFIGQGTDLSNPKSINITQHGQPSNKKFQGKTLSDLEREFPGEIVTARYNDELRVYHVPDRGLRAASELSPRLSNNLQTASAWKNLFTRGTTGDLSLFAPISHAFSAQQVAINTAAREGVWKGVKSIFQGLKGTGQIMAIDGAKNISTFLGQRIARHTAKTGMPSNVMAGLQKRLDARIQDTMLNQVRRESGRTQSGMGNIGNGTMDEIMQSVGRDSSEYFGKDQMGLLGSLWKTWNNSWHEGPAYGAMLRHIGEQRIAGNTISPQVMRDAVDISKTIAGDMRRRGASGFAEGFNASVPFSAAMLQSWNSIGSAAKHDWGKFMIGASALIGVPTLSELAYNKAIGADGRTFPDPSGSGKEWTYDDYLWNGFNTQQRVDNFIFFVPGKPPWEAILVPVSPEWGLFRGIVIEAADALFDLSNVGAMSNVDQDKTNRSHFWTSLARVTDVPLPPLISAGLSAAGADVALGIKSGIGNEAGDSSEQMSFIRNIPVGQGDRIGRNTKYDSGHMDETMTAVIQDIFGAAGAAYINVHEAFMTGLTRKDGSVAEAVDRALEAFGGSLKSQARYTQPLLGQVLRPNASVDEITKSYISSKKAMQFLSTQVDRDYLRGGKMYADGKLVSGDTVIPRDDPINMELAVIAQGTLSTLSMLDKQINALHKDIKTIPNDRTIGTLNDRNDKRDALTLELQSKRAVALGLIYDTEKATSKILSDRYDREIEIRFSEFAPRAQLPTSSIFQELRK